MRATWSAGLVLLASATSGPACALEASDTIATWKSASPEEKTKLVTEILREDGRDGGAAGIVKCLDAASGVPGHADLRISRVIEACEKDQGEPV